MTTNTQYTTVQDITRDRWGRPLVTPTSGGRPAAYTRCTTFVGAIEDTWNLGKWQQRMVAAGLSVRRDLHLKASSLGPQPSKLDDQAHNRWKSEMDDVCEAAIEAAQGSAAATTGTALHTFTERLDRGQLDPRRDENQIPEQYRGHIKAYADATSAFEAVHIETFTVQDDLRIGGTPDRIMRVVGETGLFIGDLKTGSIDFGTAKIAMQLAVYAHSDLYTPGNPTRTKVRDLRTDRGVIIHLDALTGQCTTHWIDLDDAWTIGVPLCQQVREWRKRKAADFLTRITGEVPIDNTADLRTINTADLRTINADAAVTAAIATCRSIDELTYLWAEADRQHVWTPAHTAAAAARKQQLTATQTPAQAFA